MTLEPKPKRPGAAMSGAPLRCMRFGCRGAFDRIAREIQDALTEAIRMAVRPWRRAPVPGLPARRVPAPSERERDRTHHALFETLLGFVWGQPSSILLGEVYVFVFAWMFGGTWSGCITRASSGATSRSGLGVSSGASSRGAGRSLELWMI